MLPGAVVPVTVTGEPVIDALSAGLVTRQRRRALRVGDVARVGDRRQRDVPAGGEVGREPHERRGRPGERRRRAGRAAVGEADRGDGRVGAVGRGGEVRQLPVLLRDEPDAGREAAHAEQKRRRRRRRRRCEVLLAALGRQRGPEVAGALAARRPRPAVARAGRRSRRRCSGASRAARRRRLDRRVDDRERLNDVRVVRGQLAEPHQLEEARRRSPSAGRASGRRCRRCT